MKLKKRQKLCHNCDGDVDIEVIVCPFCAADLTEQRYEQRDATQPRFADQHLSESLYPSQQVVEKDLETEAVVDDEPSEGRGVYYRTVGIIALFTIGVQLFLFSLMLAIFSHEGTLVLKWSARFWFLYLFSSIPFLLFGYRALTKNL